MASRRGAVCGGTGTAPRLCFSSHSQSPKGSVLRDPSRRQEIPPAAAPEALLLMEVVIYSHSLPSTFQPRKTKGHSSTYKLSINSSLGRPRASLQSGAREGHHEIENYPQRKCQGPVKMTEGKKTLGEGCFDKGLGSWVFACSEARGGRCLARLGVREPLRAAEAERPVLATGPTLAPAHGQSTNHG